MSCRVGAGFIILFIGIALFSIWNEMVLIGMATGHPNPDVRMFFSGMAIVQALPIIISVFGVIRMLKYMKEWRCI